MAYLGGGQLRTVQRYTVICRPRIAPRSMYGSGLGDVTGALTTAEGVVSNPVGSAVNFLTSGLTHIFGTGDVSPFQDQQIKNLAQIASDGQSWWAMQMLLGESGRVGAVVVDGGKAAHYQDYTVVAGTGEDVRKWFLGIAGNWGGQFDGLAGPTVHVGSQDKAWGVVRQLAGPWGATVPDPNQYQTNSPGRVNNTGNPTVWPRPSGSVSVAPGTISTLYGGIPGLPTVPAQPGVVATGGSGIVKMTGGMSPVLLAGLAVGAVLMFKKRR